MKEVAEESMKMAAVKEYSSSPDNLLRTDDEPMHWFCPTNPNTWCKYNAAINNNLQNYKHKPSVAKAVRDVIKPVFADLSHPALLKKCLGGTKKKSSSKMKLRWDVHSNEMSRGENCRFRRHLRNLLAATSSIQTKIPGTS
ncbi:hypothetical protein TNCV_397991 [Trichonephila clavipes]|nr:hypothetical protein TNCV_397991 [Trichonephila clavipes]